MADPIDDNGIQLSKSSKHQMIPGLNKGPEEPLEEISAPQPVQRRYRSMSIKMITEKAFSPRFKKYTSSELDETLDTLGLLFLLGLSFAAVLFCLGFDFMSVGGPGWSVWILWVCSLLAGTALKRFEVPALLANLIVGIVLRNLPGRPVDGLPDSYGSIIRATGLSLILMRSGLELDVPMVMQQGWIAARLTVCPGLVEAMVTGGAAVAIFDMPPALGFALGFILAAVSPAVVVSGMFNLQKKGFGVAKGIPSLIVAAASFDDVVAISGYSMCIGSAISTGHDPTMSAVEGPINIIAGVLIGIIGGAICGMSRVWNTGTKRTMICICMGLFFMFVTLYMHYHGAGALGSLVTTIVASYCWQNAALDKYFPDWLHLSLPPNHDWHHETEHDIATIWEYVASPLLFAVIGASIDFNELELSTIPYSLAIVCIGMAVRVPTAVFVTGGKNLNMAERIFVGLSWIPKATVQAALGSVPLDLVISTMSTTDANYHKYYDWGQQILVTAVVAILFTAPIGLVCINVLGERWLTYDLDENGNVKRILEHEKTVTGEASDNYTSISQNDKVTMAVEEGDRGRLESSGDNIVLGERKLTATIFEGISGLLGQITGEQNSEGTSDFKRAKKEEADMVKMKTLKLETMKQMEPWERNEMRKRMTTDAKRELNKRLSVHYFHRLTDHIELVEQALLRMQAQGIEKALETASSMAESNVTSTVSGEDSLRPPPNPLEPRRDSKTQRRPSLEDLLISTDNNTLRDSFSGKNSRSNSFVSGNASLDLDRLLYSVRAVMEGTIACYKIIDDQGEKFPMESMYKLINAGKTDSNIAQRNASVDHQGQVYYEQSSNSVDPLEESLMTLQRRDTDVNIAAAAFAASKRTSS